MSCCSNFLFIGLFSPRSRRCRFPVGVLWFVIGRRCGLVTVASFLLLLFGTRRSRFLVQLLWFVIGRCCDLVSVALFLLLLFCTRLLLCSWQLGAPILSCLFFVWFLLTQVGFVFEADDPNFVGLLFFLRRLCRLGLIRRRLLVLSFFLPPSVFTNFRGGRAVVYLPTVVLGASVLVHRASFHCVSFTDSRGIVVVENICHAVL